ncbi:hypothetical protein C7M52_03037 [Mixta theicola]|nr:hypothetical protein C7M52_03037 [Mixta theicola]
MVFQETGGVWDLYQDRPANRIGKSESGIEKNSVGSVMRLKRGRRRKGYSGGRIVDITGQHIFHGADNMGAHALARQLFIMLFQRL